ncbi:MAG: DNA primase [candidate division KSB1 bacterium]|nr:DNA primase [candidate division KSB1 bacterium]
MSFKIPEEKITEIREATDIVELISGYLTLKKRGKNYVGLCPFHQEKTPSFTVDPNKQMYYCFGCGKGGTVFHFLMEQEGLSFPEAVRFLAQRAGIPVEQDRQSDLRAKEKEALYFAIRFAAKFFYLNLTSSPKALEYLSNRGLGKEVIRQFGLGYSPERWDGLIEYAKAHSVDLSLLERAGLVIPRGPVGDSPTARGEGYYDRFRGRIMFPIFNLSGRVIAFGARRLAEDDSPKYINSPETPIYQKRQILYGLHQTRDFIRKADRAILVEGYTDLISLYQGGIQNVVASAGTALTEDHARLIRRYTEKVVLLYDSDSAGSAASLRAADLLTENDLDVQVAQLPEPYDPDSFIREHGSQVLTEILDAAAPLIDFKLRILEQTQGLSTPEGKARAIRAILDSLVKIKDPIKRSVTLKDVAERFFLEEKMLLRELEQRQRESDRYRSRPEITGDTRKPGLGGSFGPGVKTQADIAEENLVKILIRDEDLQQFIFQNLDLAKIHNPRLKKIVEHFYQGLDRTKLTGYFDDPEIASFVAQTLNEPIQEFDNKKLVTDCLVVLEKRDLQKELDQIQLKIKEAESRGADSSELKKQWNELIKKKKWIEEKKFIVDKKTLEN